MTVTVVLDDREVAGSLSRLRRAIEHPADAMHAIGAHFVTSSQRNIETETAPDGSPWPPLSPRTAERRIGRSRRGYNHMLRVSGRLYASITYLADESSVEWGSNLVYFRLHQLGGEIDMPAREATIRLQTIRRKGGGIRSRFAGRRAKTATERLVSIRAHKVRIPARTSLGISAYDRAAVPDIVTDHIDAELRR